MNLMKRLSYTKKRIFAGLIFILPLAVGLLTVFIPTIIKTFQFSLNDIVITGEGYTLNYRGFLYYNEALFKDARFIPYLVSGMKTLCINIVVITIFSLFIASMLNQKFSGRVLARIIFFIPVILSTGVIVALDNNAMNFASGSVVELGNDSDGSAFLQFNEMLESLHFNEFLISVVVSAVSNIYDVVKASGMQIFIFLVGLQEIPPSLYEAASVEGCSKWELFWKITFPMITPQIAVNTIYTIVDSCTQNSDLFKYTGELAFNQGRYGISTAMSVLYLVCLGFLICIVFFVLNRFSKKNS